MRLRTECPELNTVDGLSSDPCVLFADDDADVRRAAELLLSRHGIRLRHAATPDEIWSGLAASAVDVILLDLNFGPGQTSGAEGLRCLRALVSHDPDIVVVVVTGHSGIAIAVAAMRAGATDFVMKPWNNDRLVATLRDAMALRRERRQARMARPETAQDLPIVGNTPALQQARDMAARVAPTDAAILLLGEAGVGKSLFAGFIHLHSARAHRRLHLLEPAAILVEGPAALETAFADIDVGDTLFVDGIDGLAAGAQSRLATLLASRDGVRLIGAARCTRVELSRQIGADLLYRFNVVEIALPRLRDLGTDRLLLATHFLRLHAARHGRAPPVLSTEASAAIEQADWPGNLRELRQAMERAVVLADGQNLTAADVVQTPLAALVALETGPAEGDLNLARSEKAVVQAALRRHGFNVSRAAQELGLTRATLYRRMARHGL